MLGGQQPAQRLRKNPAEREKESVSVGERRREGCVERGQRRIGKDLSKQEEKQTEDEQKKKDRIVCKLELLSVWCSVCTVQAVAWLSAGRVRPPRPAVEFLGGRDSPDVRKHQNEGADDDDLQDLPVVAVGPIAAQSGHPWHQKLPAHHQKTGHHGHGETPGWQTKLDP